MLHSYRNSAHIISKACSPAYKETANVSLPHVNASNAGLENIWDPNLSHHCAADGLAPHGARPSAGTVLIMTLDMIPSKIV